MTSNKLDIIVFYVNAFDSITDKGEKLKGCTVHYLFYGENGFAMQGQHEEDISKPIGLQRGKSWVDFSIREKVTVAPAIYEGEFAPDFDKNGKMTMKLVDVAFKSFVKMEPYVIPDFYVPGMIASTETAAQNEASGNGEQSVPSPNSEDSAQTSDRDKKNKR